MIYIIASILILAVVVVFAAGCMNPEPPVQSNLMQGGAASKDIVARVAHNHEVVGANPTPATNLTAASSLVAQPANGGSEISPANFIEPQDLLDQKEPCSWCQKELAIKSQPHESHGICKRHAAEMPADHKRITKAA